MALEALYHWKPGSSNGRPPKLMVFQGVSLKWSAEYEQWHTHGAWLVWSSPLTDVQVLLRQQMIEAKKYVQFLVVKGYIIYYICYPDLESMGSLFVDNWSDCTGADFASNGHLDGHVRPRQVRPKVWWMPGSRAAVQLFVVMHVSTCLLRGPNRRIPNSHYWETWFRKL